MPGLEVKGRGVVFTHCISNFIVFVLQQVNFHHKYCIKKRLKFPLLDKQSSHGLKCLFLAKVNSERESSISIFHHTVL